MQLLGGFLGCLLVLSASAWADTGRGNGYATLPAGGCPGHLQFAYDHWAQLEPLPPQAKCSRLTESSERILRGGEPTAAGVTCLAAQGVRTILDLRSDEEVAQSGEREWAESQGIRYIHLGMTGWSKPGTRSCARRGVSAVDCNRELVSIGMELVQQILDSPTSGKVYIHCAHGADRTGLFIGLLRTQLQGCTKTAARAEMDNFGFSPFQTLVQNWEKLAY